MPRNDRTPLAIKLDEKNHVEEPFLNQLAGLKWEVIRLEMKGQKPEESFRDSFTEVVMLPKLREALHQINPWMDDDQVEEVARRITTPVSRDLLENNQHVLKLLLEGTSVGENRRTGDKSPTVRYVDFERRGNNSFIAVSQFKVRIPGTDQHIIPDITLFLNGLPIAVIECKSPKVKEAIAEAIDQMRRYSEQRGEKGEGNPALFYANQLLIATCRQEAKFGTITTHTEKHFYKWLDPFPRTLNDLEHQGTSPNEQQRLVAGMLDRDNLLDILRTFTLFSTNDKGQTIKVVGRYQQFRAVKKAVERLRNGSNKRDRSGIIWHTQGSGKSLTMMFMVREMYRYSELTKWKVVYITDRTQLEEQLSETTQAIGLTVNVAEDIENLKNLLRTTSSDLVMGMIHKFQERDLEETFPELNASPYILVMTDEAHRSQFKKLGANLERALPNATRIGYTGTPTDRTEEVFGEYIDKYTMRESIDDGVTVEIVYEGRTHNAEIADKEKADASFADVFSDYTLLERLQILGFGSRDAYLDAETTIEAKAKDMVVHYVQHVFPNGFKAQVVANSREAAVRYKTALEAALTAKIAELEQNNPLLVNIERLKKLRTAVVISGKHNDELHIKAHTNAADHKRAIKSFKLPFDGEDEGVTGEVGFIIVNNMLLTGFDAPIEQVMYLDQVIRAHNLLQAIARVNRVAENKTAGFIVDYVGVGHHLREALKDYFEKEQQEILDTLKNGEEQINDLIAAHKEVKDFLTERGIVELNDPDAFYDLFYDEEPRYDYMLLFREFSRSLDAVFPRKEALDYLKDFKEFSAINELAAKHLRDQRLSMKGIPEKLRKLADQYLISKGIDQKIEPISIIDDDFFNEVGKRKREKTKAAEIEHAIRHFIDINLNIDPALYASFADTLEQILAEFKNNWNEIYKRLEELRQKIRNAEKEPTYGLHRKKQMPFFRAFKKQFFDEQPLTDDHIGVLVSLTQEVFGRLETELQLKGFWDSIPAMNRLKASLQELLLSREFYDKLPNIVQKRGEIISRIMEIAESNNDTILYAT
ncbi:MAG: type I restriction endonuclease subunit R [Blastocatellia bacterium]|nr:type I restriction endonuclease subunit R [Blastocatellia bacterium]